MAEAEIELDYERRKHIALVKYAKRNLEEQINILNYLKEKYKSKINSNRTYERINDLPNLIKVLEKRSVLSCTDISVLEEIYCILKIKSPTKILEGNKNMKGKSTWSSRGEDIENQPPSYSTSFQDATPRHNFSEHFQNANPSERVRSNSQGLSERVVTEISTRLGGRWQELARYLKVQEYKIHEISQDPRLTNNEAKARAMLQEFERRVEPVDLKIKLVKALELAGRRDLRHDVDKMFLRGT